MADKLIFVLHELPVALLGIVILVMSKSIAIRYYQVDFFRMVILLAMVNLASDLCELFKFKKTNIIIVLIIR